MRGVLGTIMGVNPLIRLPQLHTHCRYWKLLMLAGMAPDKLKNSCARGSLVNSNCLYAHVHSASANLRNESDSRHKRRGARPTTPRRDARETRAVDCVHDLIFAVEVLAPDSRPAIDSRVVHARPAWIRIGKPQALVDGPVWATHAVVDVVQRSNLLG